MNTMSIILITISFVSFFFGFRDLSFKSPENKNKVSGIAFIGIAVALAITALLLMKMV